MRYALAFALLAFSLVGCGAAAPIHQTASPVTLGSVQADSPGICDTYRARFQRTPLRDSAGNPVWCF